MSQPQSRFEQLQPDETLHRQLRALQVPLQSELLRAGAEWEESLLLLNQMAEQRRTFADPATALAWYRSHGA